MRLLNKLHRIIRDKILTLDIYGVETVRCGGEYGGFDVVLYEELMNNNQPIVYSFGIGEDVSFSEDIIEKINCTVFAYDPTPKSAEFVKNSGISKSGKFIFNPVGIGDKSEEVVFYLPQNDQYVSGSLYKREELKDCGIIVKIMTLRDIMEDNDHSRINILKMDIEGSEFDVIEDIFRENIIIDEIVMELHDRFRKHGLVYLYKMIKSLRKLGYVMCSISESKDDVSFIKRDLLHKNE